MLREVPLGLNAPVWVDDPDFDLSRHVTRRRVDAARRRSSTRRCPSRLPRDRPLWQMCIAASARRRPGRAGRQGTSLHGRRDRRRRSSARCCSTRPRSPRRPSPDRWRPAPAPGRARAAGPRSGGPGSRRASAGGAARPARSRRRGGPGSSREPGTARAGRARRLRPPGAAGRDPQPSDLPRRHLGYLTRPIADLLADQADAGGEAQRRRARGRRAAACAASWRIAVSGRLRSRRWSRSACARSARTTRSATGSRSCSSTCPATSRTRCGRCARSTARPTSARAAGWPREATTSSACSAWFPGPSSGWSRG